MKTARSSNAANAVLALAMLGFAGIVQAQKPAGLPGNYPNKPVRVIVGAAAGGGTDSIARVVSTRFGQVFGVPFNVENIASGVGGVLSLDAVRKAAPDGYTIANTSGSSFQNAVFQAKLDYDIREALVPIAQITMSSLYMAFYPKAPFTNVKEMIAYARANPGAISYGSVGVGGGGHLLGELIQDMAGIKMTHIPYKGTSQSTIDAIAGRIPVVIGSQAAITPLVRKGSLRGVGLSTAKRQSDSTNDVPLLAESGLPGLHYVSWIGWMGPKGLPAPLIQALNAEMNKTTSDPAVRQVLMADGSNPVAHTPEEFRQNINQALNVVDAILKKTGISLGE